MKFYDVMIAMSCLVKVAAATHIQCGSNSWQYQPSSFIIADQGQAYQVHLHNLKCYDQQNGEIELIYSSQPLHRISSQDYRQAQQRYRLLGGQMGLQGDIIYESLYQPVVIHNHRQSNQKIQLRMRVCLSRDAAPTLSSTFINARQLLGTTGNNFITFQLQDPNKSYIAVEH